MTFVTKQGKKEGVLVRLGNMIRRTAELYIPITSALSHDALPNGMSASFKATGARKREKVHELGAIFVSNQYAVQSYYSGTSI